MLHGRFYGLQRKLLHITRRVASVNNKDYGVNSTWSWYERLRGAKGDSSKEFKGITRRLSILDEHEPIADPKIPNSPGSWRHLRKRVGELEADIREMRQKGIALRLGTLRIGNVTNAEFPRAIANFKKSQRRRGELTSEVGKIIAQLTWNRQQSKLRKPEDEREIEGASKVAGRSAR